MLNVEGEFSTTNQFHTYSSRIDLSTYLRTIPLLNEDSYAKTLIRFIEVLLLVQSSVYRGPEIATASMNGLITRVVGSRNRESYSDDITALYATAVLGVIWAIQFAQKGTSGIDTEFQ